MPQSEYRIAIGLYEPAGRLPVSGTIGIDAAHQRVILPEPIKIPASTNSAPATKPDLRGAPVSSSRWNASALGLYPL
jgi:hypothetical protein